MPEWPQCHVQSLFLLLRGPSSLLNSLPDTDACSLRHPPLRIGNEFFLGDRRIFSTISCFACVCFCSRVRHILSRLLLETRNNQIGITLLFRAVDCDQSHGRGFCNGNARCPPVAVSFLASDGHTIVSYVCRGGDAYMHPYGSK